MPEEPARLLPLLVALELGGSDPDLEAARPESLGLEAGRGCALSRADNQKAGVIISNPGAAFHTGLKIDIFHSICNL